ncbi:Exodeoxyribonuclease 7 large subunit, partial [Frankliniella fusca]
KQYKLLDLSITEETGFNGKYRKAIGTFLDSSKPNGTIIVVMPKPVSLLSDDIISTMKRRIASGKNPHYVVSNVTTRERADGKGSYDIVDFKWV